MSKAIFLEALLALGIWGCAPNRDDYDRDKVKEDFQKLQVAEGVYTGLLYSVRDNSVMGALEMHLDAQTRVRDSKSADSSAQYEAVLVTTLRYVGKRIANISVGNSSFDPDDKNFQANISVTRHNGGVEQLSLMGNIDRGTFAGGIEAIGYGRYGASFSLSRNGRAAEDLLPPEMQPNGDESLYSEIFPGFSTFKNTNVVVPVNFVVVQPSYSQAESFADIFVPNKTVQVTLNYSDSLKILHDDATWDIESGTIFGKSPFSGNRILNLNCRTSNDKAGYPQWRCSHNGNDSGLIASSQTYSPADYKARMRDDINGAAPAISKRYQGTATYGRGSRTVARLETLYPARTRDQQILEQFFPVKSKLVTTTLSLFENPQPIRIPFEPAKTYWDESSGTLNALREESHGAEFFVYNMTCSNFFLEKTKKPFICDYSNNSGPNNFHITFTP